MCPQNKDVTRRTFLKAAVATVAAPYIIPGRALGLDGATAPSNRITLACIGVNGMGTADMNCFLGLGDVQVVAVCDVETAHRERARKAVDEHYAAEKASGTYKGCDVYNDFREVVSRADIDAVCIGTPDHWHVPISVAAAKAGKDVYCEKPLSRCIGEGRQLCDTIKRYGRVFQTGTQLRSTRNVRYACELVRNGRIGKVHTIRTFVPAGSAIAPQPEMPVPPGFDYNLWLGPAPWAPYTEKRCHFNFRYISDYAGGVMTDLGAHDNDIAQWGNDTERTGPVEIEGVGEFPKDGLYDTVMKLKVHYRYANGVEVICSSDPNPQGVGVRFEGTDGWIYVRGSMDASDPAILKSEIGPSEVHLYDSNNHQRNFIDCMRSRKETIASAEIGQRSSTICHLGNIAMKLGRKLRWNPETEQFIDDPEANRLLWAPVRAPWIIA